MIEFDKDKFSIAIELKSEGRGVREVAKLIGIGSMTVNRAINKKTVDMKTFTKIVTWLEMKPETFFKKT